MCYILKHKLGRHCLCLGDQDGWETHGLLQERPGQRPGAGRVLHHRGPRCNSAPTQPLHPVLRHDQPGDTLQLPSARRRWWEYARRAQPPPGRPRPKRAVAEGTASSSTTREETPPTGSSTSFNNSHFEYFFIFLKSFSNMEMTMLVTISYNLKFWSFSLEGCFQFL